MPMQQSFKSSNINFSRSHTYLERPRLQNMLESAMDYPLVALYAGAGYGKTFTVDSFLQKYEACTSWLQLSDKDNVTTHFWEDYIHMVTLIWPEIGAGLLEIGFPDTDEALAKHTLLRHRALSLTEKYVWVFDDFHLLHNPDILHFIENMINRIPSNLTVMLLSRTVPEINITGMMMHDRVFTIREDTLCFTEDEIYEYFKQLSLPASRQDARDIYDDTRGWAFAINLIGQSLRSDKKYKRYALETMKANIFELIETEISRSVSNQLWRFLLRISLIDNLTSSLIRILANDDALISEMESLHAFIRYDSHLGAYMIHNLFLDYLRQYQHELSEDEKRETYNNAGNWCGHSNNHMDALSYYNKARNYDAIIEIIYTFSLQAPQDMAQYASEILDSFPEDVKSENPLFPVMHLKLQICLGLLEKSSSLAEQYAQEYETRPESPEKNRALAEIYGIWAVLRMITGIHTDVYDFNIYFAKHRKYYKKKPYTADISGANLPIWSYALLIGTNRAGAPEEYIQAITSSISHSSQIYKGWLSGFDDLARGELYFCQREFGMAEQQLKLALSKSRANRQFAIQNRALQYLMMISLSSGDVAAAGATLQAIEAMLDEKDFASRYEAYDLALSSYHFALGQPDQIPAWLKEDFSPNAQQAFSETYINRIKAQYRYMTQQYASVLAFLENMDECRTVLFSKLAFKILEALSLYQTKRRNEAIAVLTDAFTLAAPNNITTLFTQQGKGMRTLTTAALKDENCSIPREWLENIKSRASVFAKRQSHMASSNISVNENDAESCLTKREVEILRDLAQGLSRTEIALSQNISTNTVKLVTNIIYEKLCANNMADAIRIAISRKII